MLTDHLFIKKLIYYYYFRAADVFQAPLDLKSAKELLQVFREKKAVR